MGQVDARATSLLRLRGSIMQSWCRQQQRFQGIQNLLHLSFLTFPIIAAPHCSISPHRLGIAFAYYGVILTSAELLERDLVCGSAAPPLPDSSDDSEESHSPCHCRLFGPAAYQSTIISTAGEIARNLFPRPCPAIPLSQCSPQRFELCVHLVAGADTNWALLAAPGIQTMSLWHLAQQGTPWDTPQPWCLAGLWAEGTKPPRPVLLTQPCLPCMAQDRHWCPASAQPTSEKHRLHHLRGR